MHKLRRARQVEQSPFGAQVAFRRATIGATALGALAVGATAIGALAIGALAIRALAVKHGRIQHLYIGELEVGRLHVRELVVEQEQRPVVEQERTPPPPQASEKGLASPCAPDSRRRAYSPECVEVAFSEVRLR